MTQKDEKAYKANINELMEHGDGLLKQNMQLIDRLKDIETGRIIHLPSQCTPNMYNNVLGWLKKQKESMQSATSQDVPELINTEDNGKS